MANHNLTGCHPMPKTPRGGEGKEPHNANTQEGIPVRLSPKLQISSRFLSLSLSHQKADGTSLAMHAIYADKRNTPRSLLPDPPSPSSSCPHSPSSSPPSPPICASPSSKIPIISANFPVIFPACPTSKSFSAFPGNPK